MIFTHTPSHPQFLRGDNFFHTNFFHSLDGTSWERGPTQGLLYYGANNLSYLIANLSFHYPCTKPLPNWGDSSSKNECRNIISFHT